jgi:hypothetical protein
MCPLITNTGIETNKRKNNWDKASTGYRQFFCIYCYGKHWRKFWSCLLQSCILYFLYLVQSLADQTKWFRFLESYVLCTNMKIINEDLSLCHRLHYIPFKKHWCDSVINPKLFQNTEESAMLISSISTYLIAWFAKKYIWHNLCLGSWQDR